MSKTPTIACYGEILWDVFPDEKRLGGAPLNVAARLQSFDANVSMISAVGKDQLGKIALAALKEMGLDIANVQTNNKPTGQVQVTLDTKGSATYEITENVAWDYIKPTDENIAAVTEADAFVIGSLAFRETVNQEALEALLEKSKHTIFDLNLRAPFYDLDIIVTLMEAADMIKMNDEEMELMVSILEIEKETLEEELKAISKLTETATICVTMGSEGAMLLHKGKIYTQVGFPTTVVDTVGAGDSFLAGLIYGLLTDEHPQDSLEVACGIGSLVASKAGANPTISNEEINALLS